MGVFFFGDSQLSFCKSYVKIFVAKKEEEERNGNKIKNNN